MKFLALPITVTVIMGIWSRPADALTRDQVINKLKDAKLIDPDLKVNADVNDTEKSVTVSTFAKPAATARDRKIDAVLMAKEIMELDKENLAKVNVYFYSKGNTDQYQWVTVRAGDIAGFSNGALSRDKLLDSLDIMSSAVPAKSISASISQNSISEKTGPALSSSAPEQARLDKVQHDIQALSKRGVGIKSYQSLLDEVQQLISANKTSQANEKLDQLESSLAEQQQKVQPQPAKITSTRTELTPKVQAARSSILDSAPAVVSAIPDIMRNPSAFMSSLGGLKDQFESEHFGEWLPTGRAARHERFYLYNQYVELQKSGKYKMDLYWYTRSQIEVLVKKCDALEDKYDEAKKKGEDTSAVRMQYHQLRRQLQIDVAAATKQAGLEPFEEQVKKFGGGH